MDYKKKFLKYYLYGLNFYFLAMFIMRFFVATIVIITMIN